MPGPRDYGVATERALYYLSSGTCYYPDCTKRVIEFVKDRPICNMQITHISGANPGSARYDSSMTDEARASFANLILTCKPHHDLIDRIEPEKYPVELLNKWKAEREANGASALSGLSGLTEDRLAEMLEDAFRSQTPRREVVAVLSGTNHYPYLNPQLPQRLESGDPESSGCTHFRS